MIAERTTPEKVRRLVDEEIAAFDITDRARRKTLEAFERLRVPPREISVQFSGGITQECWMVTRSNGQYSVVYLPTAGYFSLCVDSDFGPLDIGVHGPALGCFGSV
ncbi:hypothetical protein E0K89_012540 [Aquicoccus sp. SCR17]|nr:hypothetical protein [Carideicomes alvinocaridis]